MATEVPSMSIPQQADTTQGTSPAPPAPVVASASEPLVCQWQGCQQPNHTSAETLYEHVCETHIGRKSTNNLNLQCFWGTCRTTTVKRDHITSHIRVHVPLKPHKCDFCGKSFKRPQDLKKHVKTHADESVLFNSPQTSATGQRPAPNGYQMPSNDGSYGDNHMQYPFGNGHGPFNGGNGIPAGYPYGPQASSYDNGGLTESRKRQHDALNDFFGEAKRRNIDAAQYQDLGQRFSQFLQLFAPMAAAGFGGFNPNGFGGPGFGGSGFGGSGFGNQGFGNGGNGYDNSNNVQYPTQHAPAMGPFGQAFPELRTKNDLMSIDQFLEQLQHTVYSNENAASSYQPVAGMHHQGFNFPNRHSNSPPRYQQAAATPGSYSSDSFANSTNMDNTPSLTPSSFQTSHSPHASTHHMSSNSRQPGQGLYPTLPSIGSLDNQSNAFAGPSGNMPPSSLASQYEDYEGRRRYSGGLLQRQAPGARDENDNIEASLRAEVGREEQKQVEGDTEGQAESSPSQQNIKLPSVSEITRNNQQEQRKENEEKPEAKRQSWEENVKAIGLLREYVKARLERGEFDNQEDNDDGNRTPRANQDVDMKDGNGNEEQATTPKREGASLYPVLRPVEA